MKYSLTFKDTDISVDGVFQISHIKPMFKYENNKRTSDVIGTYIIAHCLGSLEEVVVKINDIRPSQIPLTTEEIQERNSSLNPIYVKFDNLVAKSYYSDKEKRRKLSITADSFYLFPPDYLGDLLEDN